MKKKYFTVNEADGEQSHIGTLLVGTDAELHDKIVEACQSHFDETVMRSQIVTMDDCMYGRVKEIDVVMEDSTARISVTETWLY